MVVWGNNFFLHFFNFQNKTKKLSYPTLYFFLQAGSTSSFFISFLLFTWCKLGYSRTLPGAIYNIFRRAVLIQFCYASTRPNDKGAVTNISPSSRGVGVGYVQPFFGEMSFVYVR